MIPTLRGRTSGRWAAAAAVALTTAFIVSGCSSPSSIAAETVRGLPPGVTLTGDEQLGEQPVAVWANDRDTLTVITWGSSSCPPVPTALTVESESRMTLRFAPPTHGACTADFAPTSHVLTTPDGLGTTEVDLEMVFEARADEESATLTVPIRDA